MKEIHYTCIIDFKLHLHCVEPWVLTVFLLASKTPATADTKHFVAQLSLSVSLQYLYELIKVGAD